MFAEHDGSGIQYHTQVKVGLSKHQVMLDGGSAVNSVTEEIKCQREWFAFNKLNGCREIFCDD